MSEESDTSGRQVGGGIRLSERAVGRIVAAAAASVPGTASVERIAGRNYPRFDVSVDHQRRLVFIEAHLAVAWPAPVTHVAQRVQAAISEWVRAFTGLKVEHVNVVVAAVWNAPHRVTRAEVDAARTTPAEITPVRVRPRKIAHPKVVAASRSTDTHRPLLEISVPEPAPLREITVVGRKPKGARRVLR